ncbi:hypothetical protein CBL_05211 [Carabus blaptoides fortunei]
MNTTSDADISSLLGLKDPTIDQVIQLTKLQDSKIKELAKTIQRQQAQIDILISDQKDKDETIRDLLGTTTDETASESAMSTTSTTTTSQVKQQKEATLSLFSTNSRKRSRTTKLQHTAAKKPATDITIQYVAAPTKKTTQSSVVNANNHSQSQEPSQTSAKANNGIKIKEAVNRANCIKIRVDSINDYRQTTKIFDNTNTPYHTYQLSEEKVLKVVIRGIPEDIDASEVRNELVAKGYPVISATRMKGGPNCKPLPLILVQLTKPAGKEIFELTNLLQQRQQQQLPRHQEQQQQTQQEKHATQAKPSQPTNSSDKRTYAQATSGNQTKNHASHRTKFVNFCTYRNDRQHGPGGGTAILIKGTFNHYEIPIAPLSNLEATAIEIKLNNNNRLRLISVHNPPDKKVLATDLRNILDGTTPTIVAGDLNSKHPSCNSRVANSNGRILKTHTDNQNLQRTPITDTIKTLIKSKNRARCKWQRTLNPEDKRAANQLKEQVTQSLKEHPEKSWQEQITTLSSVDNSVWKLSKTLRNTESKIPPIHSRTGLKYTPTDKIEAFAGSLELQFSSNNDNMNIDHVERPYQNPKIRNYELFRKDRVGPRGGNAIYVRRNLDHSEIDVPDTQHLEANAIVLNTATTGPIRLMSAYNSPSHPIIPADLDLLLQNQLPTIIAGDFNAKHPTWNSRTTNTTSICLTT